MKKSLSFRHDIVGITSFASSLCLLFTQAPLLSNAFLTPTTQLKSFHNYFTPLVPADNINNGNNRMNNIHFNLNAKNTNKNKERIGGPRGGGRRGKSNREKNAIIPTDEQKQKQLQLQQQENNAVSSSITIPEPTSFRKQIISLNRLAATTNENTNDNMNNNNDNAQHDNDDDINSLQVCIVEVNDKEWWNNPSNQNPYGGRLWPSSLAIAQFLSSFNTSTTNNSSSNSNNKGTLDGYDVLELGCGNGLISIVTAEIGARVVASDVSNTAIRLTQMGWIETQKRRKRSSSINNDGEVVSSGGSLNTYQLDLSSKKQLPMSTSSSNKKIVVAAAMLYDAKLATMLAHKAFEACVRGAWVIIGDDDTGEREGGRQIFLREFENLEKRAGIASFRMDVESSEVKSEPLNWSAKRVVLLHLNAPGEEFSSL